MPPQQEKKTHMLKNLVRMIGSDPNLKEIERLAELAAEVNALEAGYEAFTDEQLAAKTEEFRTRLEDGETLDDLLAEAYAVVREVSKRELGLRHYDVQMIGGIAMHEGIIAEMKTGEGKTLTSTLPLYLNGLTGKGVHLVTVNDYLARRDARWMAPIYNRLGLTVGVLQMAARTENGKKAFLVDLEKVSTHEDQHQLVMVDRAQAYRADITYGTNNEFGFDYLRDNMKMNLDERVQRGHFYAIIDEVDNVLIDEARTPLIISGPSHDDTEWYVQMAQVVRRLKPEDFEVSEKDRTVTLTEIGEAHVEQLLGQPLRDPERPEDITPEQARLMGYLEQALRAENLFKRNKEYLVQARKVVIVDEFTGRMMPGRRWSDGLHQAVEAKEGVRIEPENVTYATITIQNYFRMYAKLSGMTGTALTEAEEFDNIYTLEVLAIPSNLDYRATRPETELETLQAEDEYGYKYIYYAEKQDSEREPIFWKRKDYPDVIYRTLEAKARAIVQEIIKYHVIGRPILVGTTSVELSDFLSRRLKANPIQRLAQTLILRDTWLERQGRLGDVRAVPELGFLNEPLDDLKTHELRQLARDLDISLNPADAVNLARLLDIIGLTAGHAERLEAALNGGIRHDVLNAREHDAESRIIARAGEFGGVTIATNMAGRGVDIKLGGELDEETIKNVRLLLRRKEITQRLLGMGFPPIDDLPIGGWPEALKNVDKSEMGVRSKAVESLLNYVEAEEQVRVLGGLHVIGSERHDARRIDNQLRGRAARQGDPGSSRFYLSMEDELMRLFGGQSVDSVMQRLGMDDSMPMEHGLVSRIVEQSQTRVEGANFDVRKHLLEYDDVLNTQRANVYSQRDRIFKKNDLSEDVTEMLQTEVLQRVPESLADEEGPWKLLSWLDQIQPTIVVDNQAFPSYSQKLLLDQFTDPDPAQVRKQLMEVAEQALKAEEEHFLASIERLLEVMEFQLENALEDRHETLDMFFEGLGLREEVELGNPRQLADELSALLRLPLRLSRDEQDLLVEDPDEAYDLVSEQVEQAMMSQSTTRLLGAAERRLNSGLELEPGQLPLEDWEAIGVKVMGAIEKVYAIRRERLVGENRDGQIGRDLDKVLEGIHQFLNPTQIISLMRTMQSGTRVTFDSKTHQRVREATVRLNYIYYAASFLEEQEPDEVAGKVLEHLEQAQRFLRLARGVAAFAQVAGQPLEHLTPDTRAGLETALGESGLTSLSDDPLGSLPPELAGKAVDELGRQALTRIYRHLILSVISNLWVEYLTKMEALRVSIRLEAYAQRDPLVMYKTQAFEMFQTLLSDMRMGVISRMFTTQTRTPRPVQAEPETPPKIAEGEKQTEKAQSQGGSKRKRRRKRKR